MIKRILTGAVVGLGALCAGPSTASAHPLFLQAAPSPGLVAPKPPSTIQVVLTEPVVARGSQITVTGPNGARVLTGPVVTENDGKTVKVTLRRKLGAAVYDVRWAVLGADGHVVSGRFNYGVARADGGPPPGAEQLSASGGRGDDSATEEGAFGVLARWLGIVAASLLLGGALLVAALRRRPVVAASDGTAALLQLAPLAWLLAAVAASHGVLAGASAGAGDALDFGLLTDSATGRAELARGVVVVLGTLAILRRPRLSTYAAGGSALLATYAISGHVLADTSVLAVLDQLVHVLSASVWLGGLLALLVVTTRGGVELRRAARAFAPLAIAGLGAAAVTGVIAAIREVDDLYFLRWSDYGRVVIVKTLLVGLVAAAGAVASIRARPRLLRLEVFGALGVVVLAATLAGLAQGRGQPLPAQRGTLFAGAALSTAVLPNGAAAVTLAPARIGRNTVSVVLPARTRSARIRFAKPGGRAVSVALRRGPAAWSASVDVPSDGGWYGYVTADGRQAAPVQLQVGVPTAPGSTPLQVLAVADLSGRNAARCRSHVQGVQMAIARINGEGGLDGGRKVAALVLDDGGRVGEARRLAQAAAPRAFVLAGVCGEGGEGAVQAAGRAGLPSIVGDPSVAPTRTPRAFRLAVDPYAEGLAWASSLGPVLQSAPASRTVRLLAAGDAQGRRRLAGLRAGLRRLPGVRLVVQRPQAVTRALLDRRRTLTLLVDAPTADTASLARLSSAVVPAPVVLSSRVLSEQRVIDAGELGRAGVIQGLSEISTKTKDGMLYGQAVPLLYPGDRASLDGLRGYVTGLALRDGVRDGIAPDEIARALSKPRVFTDALLAPWSPRQPAAGSPLVLPLTPQFIAPTLIPAQLGGERYSGTYFPDGAWIPLGRQPLGLDNTTRAPPL